MTYFITTDTEKYSNLTLEMKKEKKTNMGQMQIQNKNTTLVKLKTRKGKERKGTMWKKTKQRPERRRRKCVVQVKAVSKVTEGRQNPNERGETGGCLFL